MSNIKLKLGKNKQTTSDMFHTADTRLLTKIITHLKLKKSDNLKGIMNNISFYKNPFIGYKIKDGLNWLINYKIIVKNKLKSVDYYSINKK